MLHTVHCFLITTEIWCVIIQGDSCKMTPNYVVIDGEWLLWLPFNCLYIPGHFIPSSASFTPSVSYCYFSFPRLRHDHTVAAPCPTEFRSFGLLCEPSALPAHTLWYRRNRGKKMVKATWLLSPRYRSGFRSVWITLYIFIVLYTLMIFDIRFLCSY
jgi:hypothetical protein